MKKPKGRADGLKEIKITVGEKLDGKPIRKSFYGHTKKEANDKAKEYTQKRQYGEIDDKITLVEWAGRWLVAYKSHVRSITYERAYKYTVEKHLKPYFKNARIAAIRPIDIQEFFKTKIGYSEAIQKTIRTTLHSIFQTAIENDLIYKNPMVKIKLESIVKPRVKRAYTAEEVIDIIAFAKKHKYGLPIILMLKLGLRRSEALALRWQDIDFKNRIITINQSVSEAPGGIKEVNSPKTKSSNSSLPLDDDLVKILQAAPRAIGDNGYVFLNQRGGIYRPSNWSDIEYRTFMEDYKTYYIEKYEGKEPRILTPHELRHTFGSLIYEATRDIYITSRMMRHANISTTQKTYVHESFEIKREALGKVIAFKK